MPDRDGTQVKVKSLVPEGAEKLPTKIVYLDGVPLKVLDPSWELTCAKGNQEGFSLKPPKKKD